MVLWIKGSGTVQGFNTLMIGIFIQLFTSLVISRGLVWITLLHGFQKPVFYGKERVKKTIKFVEKRAVWFCYIELLL